MNILSKLKQCLLIPVRRTVFCADHYVVALFIKLNLCLGSQFEHMEQSIYLKFYFSYLIIQRDKLQKSLRNRFEIHLFYHTKHTYTKCNLNTKLFWNYNNIKSHTSSHKLYLLLLRIFTVIINIQSHK